MNYQKITKYDTANGPGIRSVLWTSGCPHQCKGCHNASTWDKDSGSEFDDIAFNDLLESLAPDYIQGLTISGGEPLASYNIHMVQLILSLVKSTYPHKDVWIWTGYLYEDIKDLHLLDYVDVLVDGPFILEQRDITHPYHGSPNQRVIDIKKSKELGKVVLYYE